MGGIYSNSEVSQMLPFSFENLDIFPGQTESPPSIQPERSNLHKCLLPKLMNADQEDKNATRDKGFFGINAGFC